MLTICSDVLRLVRDPEKDATLEDLDVLQEDRIKVGKLNLTVGILCLGSLINDNF